MGGQEFLDSIPSYERFLRFAMQYNSKLLAESQNFELLREKSNTQKRRRPVAVETGEQE